MARRRRNSNKVGVPKSSTKHNIKVEQNYICPVCGKEGTDSSMNIHHKQARSCNGKNNRDNLVAWCKECHKNYHQEHGNKTSDDYGNPI